MFDLKVETDRLAITAHLNYINIVPIDPELKSQRCNKNYDLHNGITFCPLDNTSTDRTEHNIMSLMLDSGSFTLYAVFNRIFFKVSTWCEYLKWSAKNVYNFHHIKRTLSNCSEDAMIKISSLFTVKLTGEPLNSDPEMITVFSFLLDGKIMKAIHHTRESRPSHSLLWKMRLTTTITI